MKNMNCDTKTFFTNHHRLLYSVHICKNILAAVFFSVLRNVKKNQVKVGKFDSLLPNLARKNILIYTYTKKQRKIVLSFIFR